MFTPEEAKEAFFNAFRRNIGGNGYEFPWGEEAAFVHVLVNLAEEMPDAEVVAALGDDEEPTLLIVQAGEGIAVRVTTDGATVTHVGSLGGGTLSRRFKGMGWGQVGEATMRFEHERLPGGAINRSWRGTSGKEEQDNLVRLLRPFSTGAPRA